MFNSDADANWRRRGAELVAAALDATSLGALLDFLPSVEPMLVWAELKSLAADGDPRAAALLTSERSAAPPSPLPIAHPLDYDWRFTAGTNDALIATLAADSIPGEILVYLGAPTTWEAARRALPDRRHILFDRNARRADATADDELYVVDLLTDDVPELNAAVAVVDPPWYPEHHVAFLTKARRCLRNGGRIHASFPTEMTRPGVLAERANIVQNVARMGLSVVDEVSLHFRYETPPFERAAFDAAGLGVVPDAWRRGDLLIFASTYVRSEPRSSVAPASELWEITVLRGVPVAVRGLARAVGTSLLVAAVDGATLPSVSRRHPARRDAALWTSRNRVYLSSNPGVLAAVIHALVAEADPVEASRRAGFAGEQEDVQSAAKAIGDLVELERSEHGLR
jgi:hypothetical protein